MSEGALVFILFLFRPDLYGESKGMKERGKEHGPGQRVRGTSMSWGESLKLKETKQVSTGRAREIRSA